MLITWFRALISRFVALFRRREFADRVDEELEFHMGRETEENIRRGMAPRDARAAAHRKLGNTTQVCEEVHRMNTIAFLDETARNTSAESAEALVVKSLAKGKLTFPIMTEKFE